ncbi:hypothetical protein Scep_025846 [Stephania cephalantha]|uniref:Uncharacterized protein n=1 Tax=Stephania cephalantha TaxID=152367 RepID=A0AAP0HRJ7_9MAGN
MIPTSKRTKVTKPYVTTQSHSLFLLALFSLPSPALPYKIKNPKVPSRRSQPLELDSPRPLKLDSPQPLELDSPQHCSSAAHG